MDVAEHVKWGIGERIGNPGGFGAVFQAEKYVNNKLQEGNYVLKQLIQLDEDSVGRFSREVRYLTKLNHPRIVKVVDFNLKSAPYFYVMERYSASLEDILPTLLNDYKRSRVVFNQILEGLEYLHLEGYYHRDLKPGNVIGNSDEDLVLCDLGLCINPSTEPDRLTKTNMYGGTKYYCSPEQELSLKYVDHRTDIYSFGKMLYEAFTGTTPPALNIASLPPAMQFVVNKSTKEDKENRFSSVSDLKLHFNLAMDLLIQGEDEGGLNAVINEINQSTEFENVLESDSVINRLAEGLNRLDDNSSIHDAVMQVPGKAFEFLENKYPDLFKKIMFNSLEFVNSQGWPFSYTDTIADRLKSIFTHIEESEVRSEIIKSVLILGERHNRWYVMGVFNELLQLVETEEEAFAVFYGLTDSDYELKRINNMININKENLHTVLKRLFV